MTIDVVRQAFFDTGWAVLPDRFSAGELDSIRRAFDSLADTAERLRRTTTWRQSRFVLEAEADRPVTIRRVVWCGGAEPELLAVGRDPRLVRPASELLGSSSMTHLINQAHFKLPGDGVAFPWHQDSANRRHGTEWTDRNGRGSYVQAVLAVDDVTLENGPLEFLPGSGRRGHRADAPTDPDGLPLDLDRSRSVPVTMRAGSVLIFGPYVFHRSLPNVGRRPRRVLINGYAYPGANARVYPGSGLGVPLRLSDVIAC